MNDITRTTCNLAILIPAYNEARTIAELLQRLPRSLPCVDTITHIVIDDGSTDETAAIARSNGACVVRHQRNLGLATAFRSGIRSALECHADIAVSMDADLQFTPDDIPALIEPILENRAHLVAGNRFADHCRPENMPAVKYYGNGLMTAVVNWLTGQDFDDVSSGYRAYSREALLNLNVQSSFTYTQESFLELCAKELSIVQVPVSVSYYAERRSAISGNLLRYATRTLLTIGRATRDYAPFSVFGTLASSLILPGLLLALFVLAHYFATGAFSPYIFVAFTAIYLATLGFSILVLALIADMLRGIRANQERLLYLQKAAYYEPRHDRSPRLMSQAGNE